MILPKDFDPASNRKTRTNPMNRTATKYIWISRSDGKLETINSKTRRQEGNCPTDEQLTRTKGENGQLSYYQELKHKDKRNYDWRKKLGGLLVETMTARLKDKIDTSKLSKPAESFLPR